MKRINLTCNSATSEDGIPLRHLFLPDDLVDRFVALAMRNTDRKIETCGLLLGQLNQNKFAITTLLIPKQHGSADNCEMTHEEEIFDVSGFAIGITLADYSRHSIKTLETC